MIDIHIDLESRIAIYRQIVSEITSAVLDGRVREGEALPSMNELSEQLQVSKETVKNAYVLLRKKGVLESQQGKGFYVASSQAKGSISVLFLFDRFSTYKQAIVNSFHETVQDRTDETILIFNQDLDVFEYFLNENLGRYDYYIVSPHFPLDAASQARARKLMRRIPNHKLIMVDRWMDQVPGNYGAVYQLFDMDALTVMPQAMDRLRESGALNVVTLPTSLYGPIIADALGRFCKHNGIGMHLLSEAPRSVRRGEVFLLLNSQLDSGLISLVENARRCGLEVGHDYFIISYNETMIDSVVLNGLTTISTDFSEMGREAAQMINLRRMWKKHATFSMNRRFTF